MGRPRELERGGYSILRLRRLFIRDWHGGIGWIGTVVYAGSAYPGLAFLWLGFSFGARDIVRPCLR
jgi:hypothetical protein